jgi:hypothetical protein
METASELLHTLRQLESELYSPSVRQSERVAELLADEFVEYGSSGRTYTKAQVIAALKSETPAEITASNFSLQLLAPSVALLRYTSCRHAAVAAYSLRSSLWQLQGGHWRMLFHQGTPCGQPN